MLKKNNPLIFASKFLQSCLPRSNSSCKILGDNFQQSLSIIKLLSPTLQILQGRVAVAFKVGEASQRSTGIEPLGFHSHKRTQTAQLW